MIWNSALVAIAAALTIIPSASAHLVDVPFYTTDGLAYSACSALTAKAGTFCEVSAEEALIEAESGIPATCACVNQAYLGTIAQCYIDIGNTTSHIEYFVDFCNSLDVDMTLESFYKLYDNATDYMVNFTAAATTTTKSKRAEAAGAEEETVILYSPVRFPKAKSVMYFDSYKARFLNFNASHYFGTTLMAYWGVMMLVALVFNWTCYFFPSISNNAVIKKYRQYLSLPAVHRTHAQDASFIKIFKYLIPCRLDTVLITIWATILIASQIARIHFVWPNAIWPLSKEGMQGRLVADRSGVVSLYLFPLLILFAGRNNFLQFFTRWKYSRMVAIHRWVARLTVVLVFIHTVAMSLSGVGLGKFFSRNELLYVRQGWLGFVAGVCILIQGCLYLRRLSYELFYLLHVLLAILFTYGGWTHVEYLDYGPWYYAAVAVWAFDRVIRIVRLTIFGIRHATVELKSEETLKVTLTKPSYWKPEAGQHAFIHFLRPSCFWQSHPFTIGEVNEETNEMSFYLKVKGGMTHGLYKYLTKVEGKTARIPISVEGPYGSSIPLKRFDNTVFLAGGNGIPGLYAEAKELLKTGTEKQTIEFYWIIRHWKSLSWFSDELKTFANTKVKSVVYVTNPGELSGLEEYLSELSSSSSGSDSDSSQEKKDDFDSHASIDKNDPLATIRDVLAHIEFREGRPNMEEIVHESIETTEGSLAVVACAHPNMVDDARAAVVHQMGSTSKLVEFYDQIQTW